MAIIRTPAAQTGDIGDGTVSVMVINFKLPAKKKAPKLSVVPKKISPAAALQPVSQISPFAAAPLSETPKSAFLMAIPKKIPRNATSTVLTISASDYELMLAGLKKMGVSSLKP